jgi:hypothetical protein
VGLLDHGAQLTEHGVDAGDDPFGLPLAGRSQEILLVSVSILIQ